MTPLPIQTQVGLKDYNSAEKVWWAVHSNDSLSPPPEHIQDAFFEGHERSNIPVSEFERPLVVVIGLSELGLHLVKAFGRHYDTFAYDSSKERFAVLDKELSLLSNVVATTDATCFTDATHFIVSVPAHVTARGHLDTSRIRTALSTVALYARPGSTIVLEANIPIDTTQSLLKELVASRDMKAGFSPSRLNTPMEFFTSMPKVISALDDISPSPSLPAITALYARVFTYLTPISAAEANALTFLNKPFQLTAPPLARPAVAPPPISDTTPTPTAAILQKLCAHSTLPSLSPPPTERPKALADRAMKLLLSATRRRGSWTLQTRKPRVLVLGGLGPCTAAPSSQSQSQSPALAVMHRLRTRWDVTVEFADLRAHTQQRWRCDDVLRALRLSPEYEGDVERFDHEARWHTMGLSWFDLVVVVPTPGGGDVRQDGKEEWGGSGSGSDKQSAVAEMGLDEEVLERLTRTVVVGM